MTANASGTSPQQFYITHCIRTDSVLNTVGFSVRAASSKDQALLRTAMEYPAYELPMDLWGRKPGRADAPRRLARVKSADGTMVVHSSYLEKDTLNRDRSYFTHVLLLPQVTASDVLKSWNAPEWITDYGTGKNQTLPPPATRPPSGTALDDSTLKKFLSAPDLGPGGCLAMGMWSDKLKGDLAGRRLLVARMLHGVLLALLTPNRGRLYIHAEPGLVALLTFAAARLLPPAVADDLTFTTFEPAHRGLRLYQRALIVGTYLATNAKGLDAELASARGFVLDAVSPERSSKELLADPPPGFMRLIELAAAGNRKSIKSIQSLCDLERPTPADLNRAVALSGAYERLEARTYKAEDLIELQNDGAGRKAIAAIENDLWPGVRNLVIRDGNMDVLKAFKPWFTTPARQEEILAAGFKALAAGRTEEWSTHWNVLCQSLGSKPAVGAAFNQLLTTRSADVVRLAPAARLTLRNSLADTRNVTPEALAPLLSVTTVAEFDALRGDASLPTWCRAYAVAVARLSQKPELEFRAKAVIAGMDDEMLGEYALQVPKNNRALVEELFDIDAQGNAPNLDRLLNTGSTYVNAEWWMTAAGYLPLFQEEDTWWSVLTQKQRLARFLRAVGGDPAGRPAWEWTAMRIDRHLFDPRTEGNALWLELDQAEQLLAADKVDCDRVLPASVMKKIEAGRLLQDVMSVKGDLPSPAALSSAFKQFELDELNGLRKVYDHSCRDESTDSKAFDRLAALFGTYFPPSETNRQPNIHALRAWLGVTKSCEAEKIPAVHAFFFADSRLAPASPKRRLELVEDNDNIPLHESVATDVRIEARRDQRSSPSSSARRSKSKDSKKWLVYGSIAVVVMIIAAIAWPKSDTGLEKVETTKPNLKPDQSTKRDPEPAVPPVTTTPVTAPPVTAPPMPAPMVDPMPMKMPDPPMKEPKKETKKEPDMKKPPVAKKGPVERFEEWKSKEFPKDATVEQLQDELESIAAALAQLDDPAHSAVNYRVRGLHQIATHFTKLCRAQFDAEYEKATTITFKPSDDLQQKVESLIRICKLFKAAAPGVSPSWKETIVYKTQVDQIDAELKDWEARKLLLDEKERDPESLETWKARLESASKALTNLDAATTHKIIRSRVQGFLHVGIPQKLALDEKVFIKGFGTVNRSDVKARFEGKKKEDKDVLEKLTDDPEKHNEEDLPKRPNYLGVTYKDKPQSSVSPTDESKRALKYFALRQAITVESGWTNENMTALLNGMRSASGSDFQWNKMHALGKMKDSNVFSRLVFLSTLVKDHPKAYLLPSEKKDK